MTTITQFPKPAGPSHRQRSRHTIVAARRAGSVPSQRGTYPSRAALLTASLVCFAVAGVVLAMEIFG